jgi:hypothetical protein
MVVNTFRSLFPKKGEFFLSLKKPNQIKGSFSKNIEIFHKFSLGKG